MTEEYRPISGLKEDQELHSIKQQVRLLRNRYLVAFGIDPDKPTENQGTHPNFPGHYQNHGNGDWSLFFNTERTIGPETKQIRLRETAGESFVEIASVLGENPPTIGPDAIPQIYAFFDESIPPDLTPQSET